MILCGVKCTYDISLIEYYVIYIINIGAYSSYARVVKCGVHHYVLRRRLCTISLRPMVATPSPDPASPTLALKVVLGGTVAILVDRL